MQGVEFEDQRISGIHRSVISTNKNTWLVGLIMKISGNKIKNEQQANLVLILVFIIIIIISIYNFSHAGKSKAKTEESLKMQKMIYEQTTNSINSRR